MAVLLALALGGFAPVCFAAPATVAPDSPLLSVLSYNVLAHTDSLADDLESLVEGTSSVNSRIQATLDLIREADADIVALQEVTPGLLGHLRRDPGLRSYQIVSTLTEAEDGWFDILLAGIRYLFGYQPLGQAILSKWPIGDFRAYPISRPLLVADISIDGLPLRVATCHLDSFAANRAKRKHQLEQIFRRLASARNALLLGDFNFGDDAPEQNAIPGDYVDVWPTLRPDELGHTYDPETNALADAAEPAARIDRILVRASELVPVKARMLMPVPGSVPPSDHFAVYADFSYRRGN